jgi:hypothetical protein
MKLKKILNEIRLNELGDTNFHYDVRRKIDNNGRSYIYIIDDDRWQLNGKPLKKLEISIDVYIVSEKMDGIFADFLKNSPYYKQYNPHDNINDESEIDEFNKKYANKVYVSFEYDDNYGTISNDIKMALNIMGTVTWCIIDSINNFNKTNHDNEIHFIKYNPSSKIKKDRKTGDDVSDGGAKRDKLYKMFIEPRVTGYEYSTKGSSTLIQFDKIK